MKKTTRTALLAIVVTTFMVILLSAPATAVGDSAYKFPTANPSFTMGSIVSGNYVNVQTSDNTYMRIREGTFFFIFRYLECDWESWPPLIEASREKVLDLRVEMEGRQSDAGESWRVQFYDYDSSGWDSTWYNLGSFPTSGEATLTVAVGDAPRARRFVSPAGAFRARLASNWDLIRTDLYIDLFRARIVYDATAPASGITAPSNGELTNAHSYLVTGVSQDPGPDASGVIAVEVSLDGGATWRAASPGSPGDFTSWSYSWSSIPEEGVYNIRSRARDAVGNAEIPGPGVSLTVDWTPPAVTETHPADGASPAAVTSKVWARLYDANGVDAATVNSSTFTLRDGSGNPVAGSVSYDPATMTATFVPASDLAYGTQYTATLATGIADHAGNHLAADYAWGFTTAPQPPDYILAYDQGWVTEGDWYVEPYTQLPYPLTGPADLLTANDAGATASYTIPAGYSRVQVASARHWQCGLAEVLLDGEVVATVDLYLDNEGISWGEIIYADLDLDPTRDHVISLRATGEGGPGWVEIDGERYDLTWMHFVNVQWLRYW